MENQLSQLIQVLSAKEANDSGKLPLQTVENPKENVSAITLMSGKELVVTPQKDDEEIMDEEIEIIEDENGQTVVRRPPQHPCGARRQRRNSRGTRCR